MMAVGIELVFSKNLESYDGSEIGLSCTYTERESAQKADALVMVTARLPNDELYYELQDIMEFWRGRQHQIHSAHWRLRSAGPYCIGSVCRQTLRA